MHMSMLFLTYVRDWISCKVVKEFGPWCLDVVYIYNQKIFEIIFINTYIIITNFKSFLTKYFRQTLVFVTVHFWFLHCAIRASKIWALHLPWLGRVDWNLSQLVFDVMDSWLCHILSVHISWVIERGNAHLMFTYQIIYVIGLK